MDSEDEARMRTYKAALRVALNENVALNTQVTALQARGTELVEERRRLRAAFLCYIDVYGGADHHPQDCENSETCLQCRADALADEALANLPPSAGKETER